MFRLVTKIMIVALCVSFAAADTLPLSKEYLLKFRQDNPKRSHWTDADICDHVAAEYPDRPELAKWTKARAKEREDRIAADSKWDSRSVLPWEKPPIAVVFSRKVMKWIADSPAPWPVVVVTNQSKKTVFAVEVLFKIDGEMHRRLVCDRIGPEDSVTLVLTEVFGQLPVYERKVRFICSGFKGSFDVKVDFD